MQSFYFLLKSEAIGTPMAYDVYVKFVYYYYSSCKVIIKSGSTSIHYIFMKTENYADSLTAALIFKVFVCELEL